MPVVDFWERPSAQHHAQDPKKSRQLSKQLIAKHRVYMSLIKQIQLNTQERRSFGDEARATC